MPMSLQKVWSNPTTQQLKLPAYDEEIKTVVLGHRDRPAFLPMKLRLHR